MNNQPNPEFPLTADLLNKISETIEQAKKAINKEELKKLLNVVIIVTIELQERTNKASVEFLNQRIAELKELVKKPNIVKNRYSIDFMLSKTAVVFIEFRVHFLRSIYVWPAFV
ncbi:MAG: hypothetical protein QM654_16390 [Dysgonamonadaceae bacterium]